MLKTTPFCTTWFVKSGRILLLMVVIIIFGSFMVLMTGSATFAQSKWYTTGYLQYSQGDYIFGTNTGTLYLVPGLRYETSDWNFSAIMPVVSQNNDDVTAAGGMLLPHGGSNMSISAGTGGMMGGSSTMGSMSTTIGLGDLFLTGECEIIHPDVPLSTGSFGQEGNSPTLGIDVQMKVPTASTAHNFGTGKFDFGASLNYRQLFGAYVIMANAGYLLLGKPAGVDFRNPFTYGGGVGTFFGEGDLSVALLYQGYTTVLSGYSPPNQASLGLNYKFNSDLIGTVLFSKGLTNTASNFGITAGFRWGL